MATSIPNWVRDFRVLQTEWRPPGGTVDFEGSKVHTGFLGAWNKLRAGVFSALEEYIGRVPAEDEYSLSVTGHSMGAAVATLMMAEILTSGGTVIEGSLVPTLPWRTKLAMYTYGQPRTGNLEFAKGFHKACKAHPLFTNPWRVVNKGDIVPQLPPRSPLNPVKYYHISTEVWYMKNGSVAVCDGTGEDPTCSDSLSVYQLSPDDHTTYLGMDASYCKA